ncbi:hypothetical protein WJX82_010182 [Trebouxia sp. C0006]
MDGQYSVLAQEGWHVKDEAKQRLFEEAQEQNVNMRQLLLNSDLRKLGQPHLPENVNHADSLSLKGAHVLQIMSMEDVSKPSKGVGVLAQRLLRLKLTDGKLSCIAAEFKPVPQLTEDLPPGTKLCCTNATVRLGVLLLDAKCIQVLGGHVEGLVETWTFQRKFGNVQRAATTTTDDTEQPPAFQNFVPGRRHNQAGQRAPPQQAGYPTTDLHQSSGLAAAAEGTPNQAALGTSAKALQPSSSSSAVRLPPGLRPPQQARTAAGVPQEAAGSGQQTNGQSAQAEASGRGATAAEGQGSKQQPQRRRPQEAVGEVQHNQAAVKHKLLERLADDGWRDRGRGRGRGRRGRRGHDDEEDSGMTLDEYEAMQRKPKPAMPAVHPLGHQSQLDQDEALARQLQQQLDVEEAYPQYSQEATQPASQPSAPNRTPATAVAHDLAQSLFAFDRPQEEERGYGRGRGRGGRRGSRGRGRR